MIKEIYNGKLTERAFWFGFLEYLQRCYVEIPTPDLSPHIPLSSIKSWFVNSQKPSYDDIRKYLMKKNPKMAVMSDNSIDKVEIIIVKNFAFIKITLIKNSKPASQLIKGRLSKRKEKTK